MLKKRAAKNKIFQTSGFSISGISFSAIRSKSRLQKNKNIQHINEGRKSLAKQLSAGNNYSLTSCVGSNPRPKHALLSHPALLAALRAGYIYSLYSASRLRLSASARLGYEREARGINGERKSQADKSRPRVQCSGFSFARGFKSPFVHCTQPCEFVCQRQKPYCAQLDSFA